MDHFCLTDEQFARIAPVLPIECLPVCRIVLKDKGYDSNAIRRQIEAAGAAPNIPLKINRRWKPCFSPVLYRGRNAIERMFGRLKDFRRIDSCYDRLSTNNLTAVCLAAAISYWSLVRTLSHCASKSADSRS